MSAGKADVRLDKVCKTFGTVTAVNKVTLDIPFQDVKALQDPLDPFGALAFAEPVEAGAGGQELLDPGLGRLRASGPHEKDDSSVGEVVEEPFQNRLAQEAGGAGDENAFALESFTDS